MFYDLIFVDEFQRECCLGFSYKICFLYTCLPNACIICSINCSFRKVTMFVDSCISLNNEYTPMC